MAITRNGTLSEFPDKVDTFKEYTDLQPSQKADALRYDELRLKDDKTASEEAEFAALEETLDSVIERAYEKNKLQEAMVKMQDLLLNKFNAFMNEKISQYETQINNSTSNVDNLVQTVNTWYSTLSNGAMESIYPSFDDIALWNGVDKDYEEKDDGSQVETIYDTSDPTRIYGIRTKTYNSTTDTVTYILKIWRPVVDPDSGGTTMQGVVHKRITQFMNETTGNPKCRVEGLSLTDM